MVNVPVLAGIVLVAAGGTTLAAGFGAFDEWAGDQRECPWHIDVPMEGSDAGELRLVFNNSVVETPVRVCVYDSDGLQRVDTSFSVPVAEAHEVTIKVPTDRFLFVIQWDGPYEDRSVMNSIIEPSMCEDRVLSKVLPVGQESGYSWYGLRPATCVATGEVVELERPDSEGSSMSLEDIGLRGAPGLRLGSVLTVTGLMVLGVANINALSFGVVALFSRLLRPRLLDEPTRSQIVELIQARPGIRFHEVAKTLDLGQGRALHHLQVLVRERILSRVQYGYFVAGRHSPAEMRRLVALGVPAVRAFYDAVKTQPTRDVSELARELGVTPSWAAKVAKRLEIAGLVSRQRAGRTCQVRAVSPGP